MSMETTALPKTVEEFRAITSKYPHVVRMVDSTVPTMHGWCSLEKAHALAALVLHLKAKMSVEIGVCGGRSLLPIAWAAQVVGGKVIGIDAYDAQESSKEEFPDNQKWWAEQDHGAIRKYAEVFVTRLKLSDTVRLIVKPSDQVEPPDVIDLLHIDGGHTDVAVRDAERFGPKVPVGGVAVMDDIMWIGGGVLRAIDTLQEMGFTEVVRFVDQNWNIMQRVK